jgi:hexosaminidase
MVPGSVALAPRVLIPAPAALGPGDELGPEGYRLEVRDGRARIEADGDAGRFYAEQTLRALSDGGPPPDVAIADRPRFAWRGVMLDVARHFFGVDDVLRLIDHLAAYKLNRLHLHLSDDQGWRIAIDGWPRLAERGGRGAVGGDPGGFYTQDDYRAIVRYAAERFITVVPEIDTPGHVQAALASYPELAGDGSADPYTGTSVGFSSLDAHDDLTYRFLGDVLAELAALTPGEFLHIGGDEAHSTTREDYLAFMARLQPLVTAQGKRLVGWEEVASAPLAAGSVVQYWNTGEAKGHDLARAAAAQGAQLIMSPGDRVYLDMKYDESTPLGQAWAGYVEVRDSYDWDPATLVEGVGEEAILGVEAPVWTETLRTLRDVEAMLFPRVCAVAEVAWTPQERRGWEDFRTRLAAQGPRWDAVGVAYTRSPQIDWPT